jgi:SAM-dependent methyltransferase
MPEFRTVAPALTTALAELPSSRMADSGGFSAGALLERAFALSPVRRTFRAASDWIDLQWSLNDAALRAIAPRARGRLLDVGCGDKPYEGIFRPYVTEYIGVEHEATFAETSADSHAVRPDVLYDGQRLPFEDKSFDTVLNVQVLEHTPHPGALVKEMGRVLKNDGVLILTAPFSFRLHEEPHD